MLTRNVEETLIEAGQVHIKKYVQFTSIYLHILHYKLTDGWKGEKMERKGNSKFNGERNKITVVTSKLFKS